MNDKEARFAALRKSSADRVVHQFTFVTGDLFTMVRELTETFRYTRWTIQEQVRADAAERVAVTQQADGMSLQVVQPLRGESIYAQFLSRYGKGVLGFGEYVLADRWEDTLARYREKGIRIVKERADKVWLELFDRLGAAVCLTRVDCLPEPQKEGKKLIQLCMVTDDVERLSHDMCELLDVGPWEIGNFNPKTGRGIHSDGYSADRFPDFAFLAGIGFYGNMEMELIEPQRGPIQFFSFLNRRGPGIQHIKEGVPTDLWEQTLQYYREKGIGNLLAGKIGPCGWCNLATEDRLGVVYELGDSVPMDLSLLPEGYNAHYVC